MTDTPFYPNQLQLFASTSILVGIHGAGLANLIFMRPGTTSAVIEILHGVGKTDHYQSLAVPLGMVYRSVKTSGLQIEGQGMDRIKDVFTEVLQMTDIPGS